MAKKQPKYERRLFAAWRVLFPCVSVDSKGMPRGAKSGFRQRLANAGVTISKRGLTRWLEHTHPMPPDAYLVLQKLERDARHQLHQQGKTLG